FTIHSYEVDLRERATLESLCSYFQEAAWNHAEALGVGYARLAEQNRIWVLSWMLVEIKTFPRWGEAVQVQTWPRGVQGALALRDFEFLDSGGKKLAAGSSGWLVLDRATRRPQRVDKFLANLPALFSRKATDRDSDKLPDLHTDSPPVQTAEFEFLYTDTDLNAH